ncbi:unnamed protein product [Mytilus coruscus]|uniref:Uncharacterized protein n=1 Tax=Mytilus coruscus TaxID=42192 RepID=A0A6J8F3F0_MYTCO|nr:unnamed protein product [Mytilus coruscus]
MSNGTNSSLFTVESIQNGPDSSQSELASNSFLKDSFLKEHEQTKLFSFQTPSHDSLHALITHSTAVRPSFKFPFSGTANIQEEVPPTRILFQPESSVCVWVPHSLNYKMELLAKCSEFHGYPQDNGNTFLTEFICKTRSLLASAKMAEAYGYRKHVDSVNAAGLFKNKSHDNRRTTDDQYTEVRDLRQQIQELSELVKAQKEMKSDKRSPQTPAAASSEISEMKDQIQSLMLYQT